MTPEPQATRGIRLGSAFGGRIVVQPSTLLMLAVLAFFFGTNNGQELTQRGFTIGLILAVLLFVSVFLHELAHAAAARALGRQVHEVVITLWGGHTSFDARGMTPRVAGLTAIAGPAANLVIAGIAWGVLATGALDVTLIDLIEGDVTAYLLVRYLAWANLVLAIFNALPGIPMDGGRVLESVVWAVTGDRYRGVIVAAWGGRVVVLGVIAVAVGGPFAAGRAPDVFDLMWAALVAIILWPAATQALRAAKYLRQRDRLSAGTIAVPALGVPYTTSVADAIAAADAAGAREVVMLGADGAPAGHFPVDIARQVPQEDRDSTQLTSVVMPLPRGAEVPASLGGEELVNALREWWGKTDGWVVKEADRVTGVARLSDVMEALR